MVRLDAGATTEEINQAFVSAAQSREPEIARLLLDRGADITQAGPDKQGRTPLIIAASRRQSDVLSVLLAADVMCARRTTRARRRSITRPTLPATKAPPRSSGSSTARRPLRPESASVGRYRIASRKLDPTFRQSKTCRPRRDASSTQTSVPRQLFPNGSSRGE